MFIPPHVRRKYNLDPWGDRISTVPNNSSCRWSDMEAERIQFEQDFESIFRKSPTDLHDDHKE